MKNLLVNNVWNILLGASFLLMVLLCTSCSSSRGYYEQGPDGKIHKVREPQCIQNW